ncbi:MAG: hypothetical protein O6846_03925 [Thaumarchaeota archaeon]|nr:hypothetical protein [Nitrososphaerota archaeon]
MRNYEGDLTIDSTSFWAFVEENLFDFDGSMGGFNAPSWNTDSGELEIPHEEGKTLYIDGVDFWSWIIKDFCPNHGDEYAFDHPNYDADMETIYIKFAASNECHPCDWATKPEWMENTK